MSIYQKTRPPKKSECPSDPPSPRNARSTCLDPLCPPGLRYPSLFSKRSRGKDSRDGTVFRKDLALPRLLAVAREDRPALALPAFDPGNRLVAVAAASAHDHLVCRLPAALPSHRLVELCPVPARGPVLLGLRRHRHQ